TRVEAASIGLALGLGRGRPLEPPFLRDTGDLDDPPLADEIAGLTAPGNAGGRQQDREPRGAHGRRPTRLGPAGARAAARAAGSSRRRSCGWRSVRRCAAWWWRA